MITDTIDIPAIRADFPILAREVRGRPLVYLDNAATTHKPRSVLEEVLAFYRDLNSNVHRGAHSLSEQASDRYEAARETVRRFIGAADACEVVFTHGTTDAINLLAASLGEQQVGVGDEIVVTEMEHHSNLVPWQKLCARIGATLKIVPFDEDGSLRTEMLESRLTERTRLFALTHVSNVLGTVNPVKELVRLAHARDIPVLVDAAQSVPRFPVDVGDLGCDFLVFSGHKMYAETGIGVLYGGAEWLRRLPAGRYGGGMVATVDWERTTEADLPFKFEAGTPNVAGAVSLDAAIRYLNAIGMEAVAEHERQLMRYAMRRFTELDGVRVYGETAGKCGAVSFNLDGAGAYDVALILDTLGIAVRSGTHCAQPIMRHYGVNTAVRASFALYNTTEEIDALIDGVKRARAMLR